MQKLLYRICCTSLVTLIFVNDAFADKRDVIFRPKKKGKVFDMQNDSSYFQRCRIRAGHDYLWVYMTPRQRLGDFYLLDGYHTRQVSMVCVRLNEAPEKQPGVWYKTGFYKDAPPPRDAALTFRFIPQKW